jgi:predicted nucleic acid-binding protein
MLSSTEPPEVLADTSVAVPLILGGHEHHDEMVAALTNRPQRGLAGHAAFETYSVLTRLAPPNRLSPEVAMRAISHNFPHTRHLAPEAAARLCASLPRLDVSGGAVFDALVGAVAREHDAVLLTRDRRAQATYWALGVRVEFLG